MILIFFGEVSYIGCIHLPGLNPEPWKKNPKANPFLLDLPMILIYIYIYIDSFNNLQKKTPDNFLKTQPTKTQFETYVSTCFNQQKQPAPNSFLAAPPLPSFRQSLDQSAAAKGGGPRE